MPLTKFPDLLMLHSEQRSGHSTVYQNDERWVPGPQDDGLQQWTRFVLPSDAELLHIREILALPVQYQSCIADYRSLFSRIFKEHPHKTRIRCTQSAPVAKDGGMAQVGVIDAKAKEGLIVWHEKISQTLEREKIKAVFGQHPELRELRSAWLVSGEVNTLLDRMRQYGSTRTNGGSSQTMRHDLFSRAARYPVTAEFGSGLTQERAEEIARKLRLPEIEEVMRDMTGCDLQASSLPVHVYNNENYHQETAEVGFNIEMKPLYRPDRKRFMYTPVTYHGILELRVNAKAVERCYPEEMRATLIHEFGHIYTQRLMATDRGRAYAYTEGFADLFRNAAAIRENADWESAKGCSGFEVLHGPAEPKLIPGHSGYMGRSQTIVSAALTCNRIIQLLGEIDEKKLAAIAQACAVPSTPAPCVAFADVLREIEHLTGVRGFARAFLNDPMLRFGNLQTGEITATAIPSLRGNSYHINCFKVTDAVPLYMHTKEEMSGKIFAPPLHEQHVHLENVKEECPEYRIRLTHENGFGIELSNIGPIIISPRTILNNTRLAGLDWPAGSVSIEFQLGDNPPVRLASQIVISPEARERVLESAKEA